ncbi:MAG: hypothetical protein IPH62_19465 [Ignavibacteriae bacterium]|nr:hypothetical protein [Ignavibacteriota bacterium]
MTIEKLHIMPSHTKGDDGYFYDSKYIGKVYHIDNKLIYFNDRSFFEMPYEVYRTISTEILNELKKEFNEIKDNLEKEFNSKIAKLVKELAGYSNDLDNINENISNSNSKFMSKDNIESIIDNKLNDVYKSFEKLSEQLVKQNMDNALKDSKREASGKLKVTSLVIFKELGYSPEEIKSLAESGLI